jgi:putative transposase
MPSICRHLWYHTSMKQRYQFRIYPTPGQRQLLARLFGCCRVVWNDALSLCKRSEKLPSNAELQKICITQAKKTEERQWLSEVSNIPLQQSIQDLGVAFKNFFDSLKGNRKGIKVRYPRFKKKDNRQTARFRKGGFSMVGSRGALLLHPSRPKPCLRLSPHTATQCVFL